MSERIADWIWKHPKTATAIIIGFFVIAFAGPWLIAGINR